MSAAKYLARLGIRGRQKAPHTRVTICHLNYDVLLNIFDWYRLDNTNDDFDRGWNLERWWYKLIQVCRVWRNVILASPSYLDLHLVCTYGTPVEAMLTHSPPFPLIIYYPGNPGGMAEEDIQGAMFALQQRERVRRIHIDAPAASLHHLVKVMNDEYPILQRLVIRSHKTERRAGVHHPPAERVIVHEKLRAPLMHRLTLSNVALPTASKLISTADGLVSVGLVNFPALPDLHPEHLVAQLSDLSHLEMITIHFTSATPNREVERRLQSAPLTRVTLPSLRLLAFRGGSAYLEGILARLNAPHLRTLNVEFFHHLTFSLPRLLQHARTSDALKFRAAELHFDKDFASLIVDPRDKRGELQGARLASVGRRADMRGARAAPRRDGEPHSRVHKGASSSSSSSSSSPPPSTLAAGPGPGWQPDDVDHARWHALLSTFAGVKTLQLSGGYVGDLFRALQLVEGGFPPELLPALQELVPRGWGHTADAYSSFVAARSAAGRPVRIVRNRW
ncbi:hypothetical protein BJV74DRAFT_799150 [Russula compacta]|nr:hypothetical protein BJV74DRAFT_799150 [Russula compacta]